MALREINLIPAEILHRQHLRRHMCFWAGCFLVSLTLIFGVHLYQARAVQVRKQTVTKLKKQHMQLGAKIEEIGQIQKELSRLTEKQAVLNKITRNQPYSQVLWKLAEIINSGTWLTQLAIERVTDTNDEHNLKLTGFSHSNKDLGDFLNRLSNEPMFMDVVLQYALEVKDAGSRKGTASALTLIQFQIDCHV